MPCQLNESGCTTGITMDTYVLFDTHTLTVDTFHNGMYSDVGNDFVLIIWGKLSVQHQVKMPL